MSDWVPEGSVAYDTAFVDDDADVIRSDRAMIDDGSVPASWSTVSFKGEVSRSPKKCIGNEHTCKGWKSKGSDFCSGHMKSNAKKRAAVEVAAVEAKVEAAVAAFPGHR